MTPPHLALIPSSASVLLQIVQDCEGLLAGQGLAIKSNTLVLQQLHLLAHLRGVTLQTIRDKRPSSRGSSMATGRRECTFRPHPGAIEASDLQICCYHTVAGDDWGVWVSAQRLQAAKHQLLAGGSEQPQDISHLL